MKFTAPLLILAILISGIHLAASRQDSHLHGHRDTEEPGWAEFMGSMDRMHSAMDSAGPSGNPDADFVKLMLPHHQGAIDMAKAEILYGKNPQMVRLAQEIITDQASEIQLMQLWLKQHDSNSLHRTQSPGFTAGRGQ